MKTETTLNTNPDPRPVATAFGSEVLTAKMGFSKFTLSKIGKSPILAVQSSLAKIVS